MLIRTSQAIAADYAARGIDAVVNRPLGEIEELKRQLQTHPAYLDARHADHAVVAQDMKDLYAALHPDPNPATHIE